MGDFRNLEVWRRAHLLVRDLYQATASAPQSERFGLTAQMRRAAVSIPANICEGCGRNTDGELRWYLRIALGSAAELQYYLLLSSELGYIPAAAANRMSAEAAELRSMMASLARRLAQGRSRSTADS